MQAFFARALGVPLTCLNAATQANRWLQALSCQPCLQPTRLRRMCCWRRVPTRDIPHDVQRAVVEQAWQHYRFPILSFVELDHTAVQCIASLSSDTPHLLAWVRDAEVLIATDSPAVHAAAGFDVPTLAGFVCVAPAAHMAGYRYCTALDLRTAERDGRQFDDSPFQVARAHQAWRAALANLRDLPTITMRAHGSGAHAGPFGMRNSHTMGSANAAATANSANALRYPPIDAWR